ncbi:MAG TPA: hypothetical protein VFW86_05450 [Candidatus Limnocylindrales bacterium]|nr:hypothetical protein [Candidatus Limnocylindrales bacterium]
MARTNLTLPAELIAEIDDYAGPRGRSAYVAEAVRVKLKRDRMQRIFDETRGAAKGTPSQWKDADDVYRWVRSLREGEPERRREAQIRTPYRKSKTAP